MPRIFKISQTENRLNIELCGVKLKIKHIHKINKHVLNKFIKHEIKPHTVLLAEINPCHYETLPGYYKYLNDLGYNVEILMIQRNADSFAYFSPKPKIWCMFQNEMLKVLQHPIIHKYERVIFNSKIFYNSKEHPEADICTLFPNLQKGLKETIFVQHHINRLTDAPEIKQMILANPEKKKNLEKLVVNPNYFGNVPLSPKNDKITDFISVGGLSLKRRNSKLLIDAVQRLHQLGIRDFKITIVGMGKLSDLPQEIRSYFRVLGRVNYKRMYKEVWKADYILTLLDPKIEAHERYKKYGTSGSFQLIYGFLKPCLIHQEFAQIYDFNRENALIYRQNSDLASAMLKGIKQSSKEYKEMQDALRVVTHSINETSLNNIKRLLDE